MAEDRKNLAAKMVDIMRAVGYIRKSGTNQAQGYKYVMATDVADAVREEMAKNNVSMVPSMVEVVGEGLTPSGKQTLLTLRFTWTITDGDTGELFSFQSIGTGSDSSDKAAYKAATGALKYALLTAFLIPTGDDPENDGGDKAIADAAARIFEAKPAAKAPAKASTDFEGVEF